MATQMASTASPVQGAPGCPTCSRARSRAAVAIGTGFGVSAMYATMQLAHPLVAPDTSYYLLAAAGIVVSLGIIAATFALLRRITGPEVARNE
jgi:hypothetical protein